MTDTTIINGFCQQLTALVDSGEPDLELILDAADIIGAQLEEIRRLEGVIANLKSENATLKQYGFYE
jgi:hypothetical protein